MARAKRAAPDCGLTSKDMAAIRKAARIPGARRRRGRLTVAERIRFKYTLYWRYGPECAYCHRAYDWRHGLTLDHIQPVSKGGALRDVRNMALACMGCNREKGNKWDA